MSAPTLVDPLAMPTMVSRLPKFGLRPKSAAAAAGQTGPAAAAAGNPAASTGARLTNGFYHHPGPAPTAGVKGGLTAPPSSSSVKQNGFIRVPSSFSMKWRKGSGGAEEGAADGERESRGGKGGNAGQSRTGGQLHQYYLPRQQASPQRSPLLTQREVKKPTTSSTGKGRGYGQAVTSSPSPSPSPQSSPRTLPVSKPGPHGTKLSQTASTLTNGTKQNLNGVAGSRQRSGASGSLRVPQKGSKPGSGPGSGPGSRSGSPLLSNPPASRSLSSDSLGSGASARLTEGDRLRSRSLTQVRRLPSPTLTPPSSSSSSSLPHSPSVTRSYSFNRPGERGSKEPASSSAQAPPRGPPAKSPLARQAAGGGAAGGDGGVGIPSLLPPSALKKPLLPSLGSASKPSGISYKLSRPSLIKQPRPLRVTSSNVSGSDPEVNQGLTGRRNSVETPSTTENSPGSTPEAPEREGLSAEPVSQGEVSIIGETLEDMSLSSTSSLERNDTSQEYMDDFDNLGNGGVGILLLSCNNDPDVSGLDQSCARFDDNKVAVNGVAKATGLCSFLEDSMDWAGVRLSGERGENRLTRLSRRRKSSQPDYQDQGGSSLDLSPSDSCGSGGTYMWDEEGLEPLGGAATSASINTNNNSTSHRIDSYDSDLNSI
ncbi:serine-rich coiled-coil domain-containing protein 2-like, partial [Centroberyx affinis]|uniref:serine-rich coiled-coil domain-containing protein 2-like n=1 Tax=Centroberyx affinis TaxID=166261 RepID=UPI003A5BA33F